MWRRDGQGRPPWRAAVLLYDSHDLLRTHLSVFMAAYKFARRLKTLNGLTPYDYICKIWTSEPDRFNLNPIHLMLGLNS